MVVSSNRTADGEGTSSTCVPRGKPRIAYGQAMSDKVNLWSPGQHLVAVTMKGRPYAGSRTELSFVVAEAK